MVQDFVTTVHNFLAFITWPSQYATLWPLFIFVFVCRIHTLVSAFVRHWASMHKQGICHFKAEIRYWVQLWRRRSASCKRNVEYSGKQTRRNLHFHVKQSEWEKKKENIGGCLAEDRTTRGKWPHQTSFSGAHLAHAKKITSRIRKERSSKAYKTATQSPGFSFTISIGHNEHESSFPDYKQLAHQYIR